MKKLYNMSRIYLIINEKNGYICGRLPLGRWGLKYRIGSLPRVNVPSSSARKVGIEINHLIPWRLHPSSSARKVGIEISFAPEVCQLYCVAFREEGGD